MKKSVLYIQSGGPTSVINSSLYGAYSEWKKRKSELGDFIGSLHGVEGIINDDLINLSLEEESEMELLLQTPGAVLGSSRKKMPKDLSDPLYDQIAANVEKHNIGYILVNGGNDSMDTCSKLSSVFASKGSDVRVIGIPKTIDNDLFITDHTVGFGSAAKYVCNAVSSIIIDATCYSTNKVTIVEVMGRNAGWLTAAVDLLPEENRPDLIYIPERKFDLSECLDKVKSVYEKKKVCIIAISEGIDLGVSGVAAKVDGFGHAQLGGVGTRLANVIDSKLGLKTRCVELNLPQRAFPSLVSKTDRDEAIMCGECGLKAAINGESGKMVTINRLSSSPYKVEMSLYDVSSIANLEKRIPEDMMVDDTRMSDSFREYCAPLIEGEVTPIYERGILKSTHLAKHKA
ncbi:MAG: diphosphate--fructose-6-phosphate 1-phosphotransferase [Bacilli bacterium]|nr:diphosphate--fructose-6-phosphate 1-phosphotransferase [Bacilli bacterium]